jgi:hypothetical protein
MIAFIPVPSKIFLLVSVKQKPVSLQSAVWAVTMESTRAKGMP